MLHCCNEEHYCAWCGVFAHMRTRRVHHGSLMWMCARNLMLLSIAWAGEANRTSFRMQCWSSSECWSSECSALEYGEAQFATTAMKQIGLHGIIHSDRQLQRHCCCCSATNILCLVCKKQTNKKKYYGRRRYFLDTEREHASHCIRNTPTHRIYIIRIQRKQSCCC